MNELFEIGERDGFKRQIFFLPLESLESLPSELRLPTLHFVLFIACDVEHLSGDALYSFAERMIAFGTVYICAWGKGCSRFDSAFDMVCVMREINEEKEFPHIMTTWHDNQSLDEALWFALNLAYPDDEFAESCSTLVVSVAGEKWNAHLQNRLANLQKLNDDVVNEG
ncbi:MAG TPA: hypothetical protein VF556_16775 [Pyrinomonadaceae bacterium]|jgi:hypothetical protein